MVPELEPLNEVSNQSSKSDTNERTYRQRWDIIDNLSDHFRGTKVNDVSIVISHSTIIHNEVLTLIVVSLSTLLGGVIATALPDVFTGVEPPAFDLEKRASPTGFTTYQIRAPILAITNQYRELHRVSPLVWNQTIAEFALRQAKQCQFRQSDGPYGENLAGSSTVNNPAWFVWFLYGEKQDYNFVNPDIMSPATKHFTQLVWAGTKQIGCAWVEGCPDLEYQLWCEFFPRGNTGSAASFRSNVKTEDKNKPVPTMPPSEI
ncbi:hypothetical protein H072_533 [Dactylellina haptotyla CBS 200.50]|uniref:SCP domain-containing protein n=1 Tax=Dactylellina haptotyla (strain CBS 200.50) TaxID=1284197 RepID=S8C181_DACHA|nr:hypothetical protein H072_533 [Dactylellina haptotyla CBS 200.50]